MANNKVLTASGNSVSEVKAFYNTRDFYQFIKTPDNAPTPSRMHLVMPYNAMSNVNISYFNANNFHRFILSVQKIIKLPDFSSITGEAAMSIANPARTLYCS